MSGKPHEEIWDEFRNLVLMAPKEIEESVADFGGEGESTGYKSGKRIVKIKRTSKADLTNDQ